MDDEYIPNRGKLNGDDRTGAALHRDRQTGGDSPRGTRDLKQNRWLASHEDQPDRDTEPPFDVPAMEFSFDGKTVRAVSVDGQNWFYANELCAVLQHSNPREAISSLDDDEKGVRIADTPGGKQKVNVVNEAGLYHLVLMSRMPRAKNFRRWVTHEVVPSIRRTGRYHADAYRGQQAEGPALSGGVQITLPKDLGRYIIMVIPGEPPHVRRTEIDAILSEGAALDVDLMASCLKTIGAFWHKVEHMRALGLDPAASFPSDRLQKAVLEGLEIARHYARVYDRETAEEAERVRAACHDASASEKKG